MTTHDALAGRPNSRNPLRAFQHGFERRFERVRDYYVAILAFALARRRPFVIRFPAGGSDLLRAHPDARPQLLFRRSTQGRSTSTSRAPVGTRLEETAAQFDPYRGLDPPRNSRRRTRVDPSDNLGLPVSGINRAYSNTGGVGPQDGDILITLSKDHHPHRGLCQGICVTCCRRSFPVRCSRSCPADIISQILNFGAPAPIDIQISGPDTKAGEAYAPRTSGKDPADRGYRRCPVCNRQATIPELGFDVDRSQADAPWHHRKRCHAQPSQSIWQVVSRSHRHFWLNPKNGVSYPIVVQTPQYRTDTMFRYVQPADHRCERRTVPDPRRTRLRCTREPSAAVISHYAVQLRRMMFTPRPRDAISAPSRRISIRSSRRPVATGRRARP